MSSKTRRVRASTRSRQSEFWKVPKLSQHDTLVQILESLKKSLDNLHDVLYAMSTKIRVEQELLKNAPAFPEKVSDPTESDAPSSSGFRQGGPQPHVQGTPKEIGRSTKETEKVLVSGGRMETPDGRS